MSHKFVCKRIREDGVNKTYEFLLESGEPNAGLLKTVFGEYILEPILVRSSAGQSFIAINSGPLLDKMMNYSVEERLDENRIILSITSQQFRTSIVDERADEKDAIYIKLPDGTIMRLENATDRALPQILYMFVIDDLLNGMTIEVNISEYVPRCTNCCLYKENMKEYLKLGDNDIKDYYATINGCVLCKSNFNVEEETVECDNFIRKTYPDVGELLDKLSVVVEIQNH